MMITDRPRIAGTILLAALLQAACGGGGGGGGGGGPMGGGGSTTYSVSVTVAGLTGAGLVLQDNGGNNLAVSKPGTFGFSTQLASGANYAVTVLTQPVGQDCSAPSGSGKVGTANVVVAVNCAALVNYWTWESGSNIADTALGHVAPGNTPGARQFASSWTDASGNLWLFGGDYLGPQHTDYLNDLWKYSPSTGLWTFVSGSSAADASGVYGVMGTPTGSTTPGARFGATTWTDATGGTLWLFGGFGYDGTLPVAQLNYLNDLWKFNLTNLQWTWVSGSQTANQTGAYPPQSNLQPGGRYGANAWFDGAHTLWLFGGLGLDSSPPPGVLLNDLWQIDVSVINPQWTTTSTSGAVAANYAAHNPGGTPPSRYFASAWNDGSGNFWLLGGNQDLSSTTATATNSLNDLWVYRTTMNQWTWVAGSSSVAAAGHYGSKDVAASANAPGARFSANAWTDASGKLWLFGGIGYDSVGTSPGFLNDLWQYDTIANKWAWVGGSNTAGAFGSYGTLGKPLLSNNPGGRAGSVASIDTLTHKVWLFGGFGFDSSQGGNGYLDDLWEFAQ